MATKKLEAVLKDIAGELNRLSWFDKIRDAVKDLEGSSDQEVENDDAKE